MSIIINDNISVQAPKILDSRYSLNGVTPYIDVAQVNSTVPISYRSLGLTVLIGNQEYWYQDGITDLDLVVKSGGTSFIDGAGVANYLPIFLDTNTLTSSIIYSDGLNIGIGTQSPSTLVHIESVVSGAFRLADTTEGNGKVLTSDSNGVGTWQNVSSVTVNKYSETILNASITIGVPITVSHSLTSTDIVTSAWDLGTGELTYPKFDNRTTDSVDVTFASIPPSDIRIVIIS